MIKETLAKTALAVADQLNEAGVTLLPLDNSVLSELSDHAMPYNFTQHGETNTILMPGGKVVNANVSTWTTSSMDEIATSIALASCNAEETSRHTLEITAIADTLAPLVQSHSYTARSVVVPLVAKFEEDALRYLELAKQIDAAQGFEIKKVIIPALLGDESFNDMGLDQIVNLTEMRDGAAFYTFTFENMNDAVAEICNLGNARLNTLVTDWLAEAPENLIQNLLMVNFTKCVPDEALAFYQYDAYSLRRGNQGDAMNLSLGMWLICRWLRDVVRPVAENVTLAKYQETLQLQMDIAGTTLKTALATMATQVQNGVMVMSLRPLRQEVTVHANLYADFLANGGKPEALLGMLVSGRSYFDSSVILENQTQLLTQWESYLGYRASKAITDIRSGFQSWVRSYMAIAITEQTDIEKEYLATNPAMLETIMKLVEEEIMHLGHRLHEDVAHTALHMVAKARFFYTASYNILNEMRAMASYNKDIDPREAAGAAMIGYLVEYLYSQLSMVSVPK